MTKNWPDNQLPVIARFEVRYRNYLASDGAIIRPPPAFASDTELLVSLYRAMVLVRAFDLKAVALQRTGRLGTYAVSLGQEAVAVGVASAMRDNDVLLPSYRDNAALIWRGVKLEEILLFWGGDERGNHFSGPIHDFPFCVPVGSQAPHAAGVAYAFKLRREPRVAVCLFGDGATSKGDVYEAMNFAGSWQLPVIFLCQNNQYGEYTKLADYTASRDFASRAAGYGFKGVKLDGNDPLAFYKGMKNVIAEIRAGGGPIFVEATTYRLGPHAGVGDNHNAPKEELQAGKDDAAAS